MPTVFDVANFFLAEQEEDAGDTISNLKLQKLCYYAQGFTLALTGEPLFPEEVQAWAHGPVIPELYRHYKSYGAAALPKPDEPIDEIRAKFTQSQLEILDDVKEVYGQYSAWKLRDMTHEESPWLTAWKADPTDVYPISHESMQEFFKTRLA